MTTKSTDRALTATQTIEQLGGLERLSLGNTSRIVTASDVWTVLDLCRRLKLDIPAELADALCDTAVICQRAHKLKATAPAYTAEDLAADDYEQRFVGAMTARLRVLAKADDMITRAKGAAIEKSAATARQHSQALIKLLNTVYAKHARAPLGKEMRAAHTILLGWQASLAQGMDIYEQWCLHFAWPQEAWDTLASRTNLSGYPAPRGVSDFDHALDCGARPYLALSLKDVETRCQHYRDEHQAWEEAQNVARVQDYVQQQTNKAIADATRAAERRNAETMAYMNAAAEALDS